MAITPHQFRGIVDALTDVIAVTYPSDAVMSNFFREHRKLGSNDRQIITETVYAVLRRFNFLSALVAPQEVTPKRLTIAALLRLRGHNLREISDQLSDTEKDFAAEIKGRNPQLDLAARAELPAWVIEKLGWPEEEILQLGESLQQAAPLDLRVNTLRDKRNRNTLLTHRHSVEREGTAAKASTLS